MELKFKIQDEVYETYVKRYGVKGTYDRMRKVLEEMQYVDASDRYILLSGDARRAVEAIFQKVISTPDELVKLTARLNAVSIAGAQMTFTSDELERIKEQASFFSKTTEEFIMDMILEIKAAFLERV